VAQDPWSEAHAIDFLDLVGVHGEQKKQPVSRFYGLFVFALGAVFRCSDVVVIFPKPLVLHDASPPCSLFDRAAAQYTMSPATSTSPHAGFPTPRRLISLTHSHRMLETYTANQGQGLTCISENAWHGRQKLCHLLR
jgi:hypothetical protein